MCGERGKVSLTVHCYYNINYQMNIHTNRHNYIVWGEEEGE